MARAWKKFSHKPLPKAKVADPVNTRRGTAHSRGYDHDWNKLSLEWRRKHPFCVECEAEGHPGVFADVVDHVEPVADAPEKRLDPRNLWSLCAWHHSGMKARLERFARRTNQIHRLPHWCRHPEDRPDGVCD